MLPLIPIALSLAPEIAQWLFGSTAAKTTASDASAIQTVTGADPSTSDDAAAAQAALAGKPELAIQLREQLAQIAATAAADARKANLDTLSASLQDTANARAQTASLVSSKSSIALRGARFVARDPGCFRTHALRRADPHDS